MNGMFKIRFNTHNFFPTLTRETTVNPSHTFFLSSKSFWKEKIGLVSTWIFSSFIKVKNREEQVQFHSSRVLKKSTRTSFFQQRWIYISCMEAIFKFWTKTQNWLKSWIQNLNENINYSELLFFKFEKSTGLIFELSLIDLIRFLIGIIRKYGHWIIYMKGGE